MTLKGPFVAREAKDANLVDGTAFDDELDRVMREMVGQPVSVEKYEEPRTRRRRSARASKVALLYVDGDMVDGRSRRSRSST